MENQLYCDQHFPTPKGKGEDKIRKTSVGNSYIINSFKPGVPFMGHRQTE